MESLERRLHGIDNRIAEREVFLLRSADSVFLAEIADADGDGVIGHEWGSPLLSACGLHTDNQGTREKSLSFDAILVTFSLFIAAM